MGRKPKIIGSSTASFPPLHVKPRKARKPAKKWHYMGQNGFTKCGREGVRTVEGAPANISPRREEICKECLDLDAQETQAYRLRAEGESGCYSLVPCLEPGMSAEMIRHPSRWPSAPFLPLKRKVGAGNGASKVALCSDFNRDTDYVTLYEGANLFTGVTPLSKGMRVSVHNLLAEGWRVD